MSFSFRYAITEESKLIHQITVLENRCAKEWKSSPLFLACADDGDIMGWTRHWRTKTNNNIVMNVSVVERYRGKKLGLHLISHITSSTPETKCWYLSCKPSLEAYYKTLGFKKTAWSDVPELFDGSDPPDQVCMTCDIKNLTPLEKIN